MLSAIAGERPLVHREIAWRETAEDDFFDRRERS
jgi:hypothetical protein